MPMGSVPDVANLNYWAYWIGELREVDDAFMLHADLRS